jgi:RNA polymerase sigma factor (sigma-70 family)
MDRSEIAGWYHKYGPLVLRRARSILGDEQAAKDALQEVFMRTLSGGAEFRGDSSPITWLYRVTTNHCLNAIRNSGRRSELLAENPPPSEVAAGASPEERTTVAQLLRRIPDELREIAIYYFVDQMNQDEIAEVVGVSRRTVGNRLEEFRAAATRATAEVG